jgi:tRNA pseudouridine32 synthase/23S rRNA pseudouridine746 synthase
MIDTTRTLYRDDRLWVLDKPAGFPAVPGRGPEKQDCLWHRLLAESPSVLVVHRLDWATSGVILFALDPKTQRELSRQFEARETAKRYVAVVRGEPSDDCGTIDLPLAKDFSNPPRHRVDHVHGRSARTDWRVLERLGDRARLELTPHTGRSHQLRVHLAMLGHPILGDMLYADASSIAAAPRLLLHAESLTVSHPDDGRRLTFIAPCPF